MFWTSEPDSLKSKSPHSTLPGLKAPLNPRKTPNFWATCLGDKSAHRNQSDVKKPGILLLLFGVLLPLVAVVFETTTHMCAQNCFDPFPSTAHVLLFMLIPISNAMVWLSARRNLSNHYGFMALSSGMAMGIGILYSLMFVPLVPMSLLMLLWLGFGLLGLSPLLSLPCTASAGKTVCKLALGHKTFFDPHQVKHIGHLIILVTVIAVELPSTLTRINLSKAADSDTAKEGIRWLRQFGSQEVMLRACYERSGRATDILGSLYEATHPLSVKNARNIFYRVTGMPFNSVPIPNSARATIQHAGLMDDPDGFNTGVDDEFDRDPDIAGEIVSGVARGLSLGQSNIAGEIDANAALANISWTFAFQNVSQFDREARAKILLPPGAVVTGATLWVDNKKREANIMTRNIARSYYRSAAVKKKDPLLVSTCGPDTILVQCYPIRPQSKMTVRLKIVSPLAINEMSNAILMLPTFEERNFQISSPHSICMISKEDIAAPGISLVVSQSDHQKKLTGNVDNARLARFGAVIHAKRDTKCNFFRCHDKFSSDGTNSALFRYRDKFDFGDVVTVVASTSYPLPANLTIIVDGSIGMSQYMPSIAQGLRNLPASICSKLEFVQDRTNDLCEAGTKPSDPSFKQALDALGRSTCAGGQDDLGPLITACSQAGIKRSATSAVLWIHGAQVLNNGNLAGLKKMLQANGTSPMLYDFQVASGPNEILAGFDNCPAIVRVLRSGSVQNDLKRLCDQWQKQNAATAFTGRSVCLDDPRCKDTFNSLAQLWAYRQVLGTLTSGDQASAYQLAATYHVVTPVSSAVIVDPTIIAQAKPKICTQPIACLPPLRFGLTNRLSQLSGVSGGEKRARVCPEAQDLQMTQSDRRAPYEKNEKCTKSNFGFNNTSLNESDGIASDGLSAADNADPATVPEADTWILLCVVAGLLPVAIYFRTRVRVCKA